MQRWGKTAAGNQRFCCRLCAVSSVTRRRDNIARAHQKLWVRWLTTSVHIDTLAKQCRITRQGLWKRFRPFWDRLPPPSSLPKHSDVFVVDGVTIVKHALVALIVQDPLQKKPLWWAFATNESSLTWFSIFLELTAHGKRPEVIVCDGQKGLLKAIFTVWPHVKLQRCMMHVVRLARTRLTQHPRTNAGQELLCLVNALFGIRTRRQKRRWIRSYRRWQKRHGTFLKERSYHFFGNKKRWWYTHRNVRAARSLLKNSLPHLFTFIGHGEIPRTTNHVEGGVNSRLKDLLRTHRGMTGRQRQVLTAWYLAIRQGQKPTRKFT